MVSETWEPASAESFPAERRAGSLLAASTAAATVAALLAAGRPGAAAAAAALPLLLVIAAGALGTATRAPADVRLAGVMLAVLAAGTFVWRIRTTQALETNPLDAAATVRVALVVTAGLAALMVLSRHPLARPRPDAVPWLAGYIAVATVAALGSPLPLQALYRAAELAVGLVVVLAAFALLQDRSPALVLRLFVGGLGLVIAVVWVEAALAPGAAWSPTVSVVPYELQGAMPAYSSNTVGMLGGLLALYGLAGAGSSRAASALALVAGLATLLAAQYRTGVVGFVAVGVLVLLRRRPGPVLVLALAALPLAAAVGFGALERHGTEIFGKGRPELVGTLDGRTIYWRAAEPVIRERPLFGWGLNVQSRRVLASLGDEGTSTIHSTWLEALLGTGLVGTTLLALAFLAALRQALRARASPLGVAVAAMLAFLAVRSLTGTTVELFDLAYILFAGLAFAAAQLERDDYGRRAR